MGHPISSPVGYQRWRLCGESICYGYFLFFFLGARCWARTLQTMSTSSSHEARTGTCCKGWRQHRDKWLKEDSISIGDCACLVYHEAEGVPLASNNDRKEVCGVIGHPLATGQSIHSKAIDQRHYYYQ
jgi:hypothetical protein